MKSNIFTPAECRILRVVELDAQRSSHEVADEIGVKDYVVQNTLRKLRTKGVIVPKPFIDVSTLGKINVAVYFSTALSKPKVHARFIANLQSSPLVAFLQAFAGDFHFVSALYCSSHYEVHRFLRDLSEWSNGAIVSKAIAPRVRYRKYGRKYLFGSPSRDRSLTVLGSNDRSELSTEDRAFLSLVAAGGITSIAEAARELKVAASSLDYRCRQLHERGVVRGWIYEIAETYIAPHRTKLLVSCKGLSEDFDIRFERFAAAHPNVVYLLETLGSWDIEVGVECPDSGQIISIISSMYEAFPDEILSIKALGELDVMKWTMFPDVRLKK